MKTNQLTPLDNDTLLCMKKDYLRDYPKPKRQEHKQVFYRSWKRLPHEVREKFLETFGDLNFSLIELIVVSFGSLFTFIVKDKEMDKEYRLECEKRLKLMRELSL